MAEPVKVRDAQGNVMYMKIVKDDTGVDKWVPATDYTPPATPTTRSGKPVNYGGRPDIPQKVVERDIDRQRAARAELEADPAKMARAQMANRMSFGEKAAVNLGREMGKFGTGIKEIADLALQFGGPSIPAQFKVGAGQRRAERAETEAQKDIEFKELGDRLGAAQLSSVPLYMATGRVLDKPATAVASHLIKGAQGVGPLTNRALAPVGNVIQRRAAEGGDDLVSNMARSFDQGTVTPMRTRAAVRESRDPLTTTYRENPIQDLLRDTVTGGVEGGLHYDQSVGEGAAGSLLGSGAGMMSETMFSKAKNLNPQADKDVLDWARLQGYRTTPGQDTGQPGYQRYESDLRSSNAFGGEMKQFDAANDKAINKVAGRVMGMEDVDLTNMTPASLNTHMSNLKKQYNDYELRSRGKIDKDSVKELSTEIENLPKAEKKRATEMYVSVLGIKQTQGRDKGKFTPAIFNGKDYAGIRRKVKLAYDSSIGKSNFAEANFYKDLIDKLDTGMERGVKEFGGEVGAKEWKELNEKYAMSKLMLNKGFTATGKVDLDKMYNHLMSNDAERTLLGRGGRITDLQKLIKLNEVSKGQVGSGFARVDVGDEVSGTKNPVSFSSTPWSLRVPMSSKARARLYMSDDWSPARHGLLHMSPDSKLWNSPGISRATQQSTNIYTDLLGAGAEEGKYVYDLLNQNEEEMAKSNARLKGLLE